MKEEIIEELVEGRYISREYGKEIIEMIEDDEVSVEDIREDIFQEILSNATFVLQKTAYPILERDARELFITTMGFHLDELLFRFNRCYKDKEAVVLGLREVFNEFFEPSGKALGVALDDYTSPRVISFLNERNKRDMGFEIEVLFADDFEVAKELKKMVALNWKEFSDRIKGGIVLMGFNSRSDKETFKERVLSLIADGTKVITYFPPDLFNEEDCQKLEKAIRLSSLRDGNLVLRWCGVAQHGDLILKWCGDNIGKPFNIEEIKRKWEILKEEWRKWRELNESLIKKWEEYGSVLKSD
jgi:hypothetical protein